MAVYKGVSLNPAIPPVVIDGTGLASTVPLLVKNGKSLSGVEVQVTGTAPSGFLLRDSGGTLAGAFGYAVAVDNWAVGAAATDVVISSAAGFYLRSTNATKLRGSGASILDLNSSDGAMISVNSGTSYIAALPNGHIRAHSGDNIGCTIQGGTFENTSGEAAILNMPSRLFRPTSGTAAFRGINCEFTINQTGGANGPVHGLRIVTTETAVGGTHSPIEVLGGAAGATVRFSVAADGLIRSGRAVVALGGGAAPTLGTIGGTGPAVAAQNSWVPFNFNGTTVFLPAWV